MYSPERNTRAGDRLMSPSLCTGRLLLSPFQPEDAEQLYLAANTPEITRAMISLPQPYPQELAADWITYARYRIAVQGVLAFAFTDLSLHRVWARILADNGRSVRAAEGGFSRRRPQQRRDQAQRPF